MRMLGMFERATWPLRRLAWWVEERLVWPLADAFRGRGAEARPFRRTRGEDAGAAPEAAPARSRRPDIRIALLTAGGAAVIGVGVAVLAGGIGGGGDTPATPPRVPAEPPIQAASQAKPEAEQPNALHGATPDFKSAAQQATQTSAQSTTQASPLAGTNSKPSSIPAGTSDSAAALKTAKTFAGAFVLYEVGKTDAKVKRTFAQTATPALARALRARPPRLPSSVKVPVAKIQNVVLGVRHGRQMDASVSLLRLGTLSELRLSLAKRHGTWAVSEVRG
jgi:hypothetical protein